jgi:hypothetical protein
MAQFVRQVIWEIEAADKFEGRNGTDISIIVSSELNAKVVIE